MATTDFSGTPDAQMEHIMGLLENNPEFIPNVDERKAFVAEYFRRKKGGAATSPQPSNVDRDLDAAASPLAPDPVVKPKGWRDMADAELVAPLADEAGGGAGVGAAELDAYGKRYRQAVGRTIDRGVSSRQAARRDGWNDPEAVAFNQATGLGTSGEVMDPDTVTVDGVTIPAYKLSDGQGFGGMYRLGDLNRAKEAADEARLSEMFSKSAQEDLEKYGTKQLVKYKYGEDGGISGTEYVEPSLLSDAEQSQQNNLRARKGVETREYMQNRALRNRPGLQALEAKQAAARERYAAMAMLAGGSQNINSGNRALLNAMLTLDDPGQRGLAGQLRYALPGGQLAAAVDAQNASQAGRIAQNAMIAFMQANPQYGNNPMLMHNMKRMEDLRVVAGQAHQSGWDKPAAVDGALIAAGATAEERRRIMAEIFGPAAAPIAPAAPPQRQPLGDVDSGMMPPMSL